MRLDNWFIFILMTVLSGMKLVESRGGLGSTGRRRSTGDGRTDTDIENRGSNFDSWSNKSDEVHINSNGGSTNRFPTAIGADTMVRGKAFKLAIANAAAGYLTYTTGKAVIKTANAPMSWNGRQYYWDPEYYNNRSGFEMCYVLLLDNSTENIFDDVFFTNDSRPEQIVWSCHTENETCCGYECCSALNTTTIYSTTGIKLDKSTERSQITRKPTPPTFIDNSSSKPKQFFDFDIINSLGIPGIFIIVLIVLALLCFVCCILSEFSPPINNSRRGIFDEHQQMHPANASANQNTQSDSDDDLPFNEFFVNQGRTQRSFSHQLPQPDILANADDDLPSYESCMNQRQTQSSFQCAQVQP